MADSEREIEGALWLNRLVSPARAGATHDSRKKKGPAKRVPRSAGFAICSPRGIGEPHDIAPRGSVHLSDGAICLRAGRSQEQVGRPRMTRARHAQLTVRLRLQPVP